MMARAYDEERERIDVPLPWPTLRDDLGKRLAAMTVSFKPEHGGAGRLHEQTAYGLVADPAAEGANLVYRKSFAALKETEIARIRDPHLRDMVAAHWAAAKARGQKIDQALAAFAATVDDPHVAKGIRRVRLLKPEKAEYLVPIADAGGQVYKAYSAGENAYVEIFETPDGKWQGEAVSVFQANQSAHRPAWRQALPGARLVMRVHKGDTLRVIRDGQPVIMVVHRLDASAGRFKLAPHHEGGNLDRRHEAEQDSFRWLMASYGTLKTMAAERVRVDELGIPWRVTPGARA